MPRTPPRKDQNDKVEPLTLCPSAPPSLRKAIGNQIPEEQGASQVPPYVSLMRPEEKCLLAFPVFRLSGSGSLRVLRGPDGDLRRVIAHRWNSVSAGGGGVGPGCDIIMGDPSEAGHAALNVSIANLARFDASVFDARLAGLDSFMARVNRRDVQLR